MDYNLIIWWAMGALVFAVIGALIAQSKNRRPIDGALLGGFLGLIGIVILACQSKIKAPVENVKPQKPINGKEDKTD